MMNNLKFISNKRYLYPLLSAGIYLLLLVPLVQLQAQGLLPACGEVDQEECGFGHLRELIISLINFMIMLSTILATAAFAWAGIILMTSGGSESAKTKAKGIFKKVLIGYLWILGAWLLVYTITSALLGSDYSLLGSPN